jgi:hypothetical protein
MSSLKSDTKNDYCNNTFHRREILIYRLEYSFGSCSRASLWALMPILWSLGLYSHELAMLIPKPALRAWYACPR